MNEQRIGGTTGRAQLPNRTTHIIGWGHEVPSTILTNADLEKIVETDHKHLLTKVQQTFRGWRARRHVFGNLPPSTPWSTRTLGRALERRRAGRVVVKNAQKYCL